jgi:hypothetical protein
MANHRKGALWGHNRTYPLDHIMGANPFEVKWRARQTEVISILTNQGSDFSHAGYFIDFKADNLTSWHSL